MRLWRKFLPMFFGKFFHFLIRLVRAEVIPFDFLKIFFPRIGLIKNKIFFIPDVCGGETILAIKRVSYKQTIKGIDDLVSKTGAPAGLIAMHGIIQKLRLNRRGGIQKGMIFIKIKPVGGILIKIYVKNHVAINEN